MTESPYQPTPIPSSQPPEPPVTVPVGAPSAPLHEAPQGAYGAVPPSHEAPQGAYGAAPSSDPASGTVPPGYPASGAVHPSHSAPGAVPPSNPTPAHGAPAAAPSPKGPSGAKTFLFGFLGALVACALAFGIFTVWGENTSSPSATTYIGTSDSSVINAVEEGQTLAEAVAAKALPSVVAVYNYQQAAAISSLYGYETVSDDTLSPAGMGSGVIISEDGYIITNYHVVEGADSLTVTIDGEQREATYVGGDKSSDVAVVKVTDASGLVAADIGNSDDLVIGEWVMTIGAPLGLEQSVATGVVSATNRSNIMESGADASNPFSTGSGEYTYYPNMIQTDAVINPGNSGGALVDADGKLIGINTMISSYSGDYAGVGFAIPVNYAMGIAQDIIDGKTPTHAILGVSISNVNAQIAQRYGLSATTGAYINAITPGTGAADSDLQVGDIITAIDGNEVASVSDVTLDVRAHNVGQTVTVTVDRNGQTLEIPVTLSSDENIISNVAPQNQNEQQTPINPYGNGGGNGGRNMEDLLRLFGL